MTDTTTSTIPMSPTGDVHDFDFLVGEWDVASRRLVARNAGCTEWDEFAGRQHVQQWLGGGVNIDEVVFPGKGFSGLTLRTFEHASRRWSIYWINSARGVLDPPVHGGFDGDRGTFHGEDVDDGVPVQVVFRWARLGRDRARWEQVFSYDGGSSWETNWVMEFSRARG